MTLSKRHVTTTLFAALVVDGHRDRLLLPKPATRVSSFPQVTTPRCPQAWRLHLILDNYSTHSTDGQCLARAHPLSAALHSDCSPGEPGGALFPELTIRRCARGVFHSVPDLIARSRPTCREQRYPKPFVWTATADDLLANVARGRVALAMSAKTETTTITGLALMHDPFRGPC